MLSILTINLNGIRSAARKGFFNWLATQNADVICVQEIRAQASDLEKAIIPPAGYHPYYHFATQKGYSGVGIYSKIPAKKVMTGLGWPIADDEGRHVAIDIGGLWISSLYMPSGTSGELRQAIKFDFLSRYADHLGQKNYRDAHIICGDFNIAHKEIDLKNWRGNQKNSGFLPEERAWMDQLFTHGDYVDGFRLVNSEPEQYTWWSNRGRAWEKNVGWRIDYQVANKALTPTIKSAEIYKKQRFSDHAPLLMHYDIKGFLS